MEIPSDDRYPVSEDHLRLEREERRFHREVNGTDYISWRRLLRRVSPDSRYRVTHFGMPTVLTGEEVLALAHATLVDRSCTYIGSVRQVGLEYEIPLEDLWETYTDPETGRTLVNGGDEDYWDLSFFLGAEDDQVDEAWADGALEPVGMSVEATAEAVIARRCEETGVDDPEAATETLWAVRRAVARALTGDDAQERTLRQILSIAIGRAEEVFDRAYGLVRIQRAGVNLDQHPEYRSLQAFFEAGFRPPTHQEAADIISQMFGARDLDDPGPAPR